MENSPEFNKDLPPGQDLPGGEETKKPLLGITSKIVVALVVVLGLSTAAVAVTSPNLLEPVVNSIPDSWFPAENGDPGESAAECAS